MRLTRRHVLCYTQRISLDRGRLSRRYSERWSECGARARNDTLRSRAASGITLTGTTTGPGGAFPGLGQAGAGNARARARGPSLPGWSDRTGSNVLPRPRKPGLELRPRAESPDGKSRSGTPIGERTRRCAPHREMRRLDDTRLSAFRFLFSLVVIALRRVGRAKQNPPLSMVGYAAELVIGPATSGQTRWQLTHPTFRKTRAPSASRERVCLSAPA